MKVKTAELTGPALDWAVAKAVGKEISMTYSFGSHTHYRRAPWCDRLRKPWEPSTNWSQGGPLIERYKIDVFKAPSNFVEKWAAYCEPPMQQGPSPLVAAMRAIVAAKFGDEVEVPDELLA